MPLLHLEVALLIGIVLPQVYGVSMSAPSSECLSSVDACMTDLCKSEKAFYNAVCGGEGCQIKGSEMCNLTIQTTLDQFPSLQGCVCSWEEELCGSIQALATICPQKPAAQKKGGSEIDWRTSSLIDHVYNGPGSCIDQATVCVSDAVCNRFLVPVLQACRAGQCDPDRCQRLTQQFYGSMPRNIAEMLFMCECEALDKQCVQIETALHSSTCGGETRICQDTVNRCAEDSSCREALKTFQSKCWSAEEALCSQRDLQKDECLMQMDPGLILGGDPECRMGFLATLGTVLHHPCSCKGVYNDDLLTCNNIQTVLHNRSHFITSWKSSTGPSEPPETNESEEGHKWPHDYLLFAFTTVLLVGVVILMPLAVISKIWMSRRRDKTKFHQPEKSNFVVIL